LGSSAGANPTNLQTRAVQDGDAAVAEHGLIYPFVAFAFSGVAPRSLAELLRIGRERHGVYWLERSLEGDPGQPAAHAALAAYYAKKGDAEKAAAHRRWLPSAASAGSAAGDKQ